MPLDVLVSYARGCDLLLCPDDCVKGLDGSVLERQLDAIALGFDPGELFGGV